ncbi:MAG: hypothetical protein ABEK04_02660 [Candidatus Nanohalobium sp.]
MDSQKIRKLAVLAVSSFSFLPFTAAAIGEQNSIQASFVEFANNILLFQVNTPADVLLFFIAPMAGFYFIQKNMLSFGFELFEERIDRHTYGRTDEDVPNGIKGLSIVTGFITVQMLGTFGAGILLATGVISIILAAVMQLGLLEGLGGAGGGGHNQNNTQTTNNTANQNQNQQGGGGGGGSNVNWGNLGQTAANFVNNVQQNRQNRQDQSIKEALSVFSNGTDIIDVIDHYPSDFRKHIQSINNGKKGVAEDVESVEEVLNRMEHIENEIDNLQNDTQSDIQIANSRGLNWGADSKIQDKIKGDDLIDQLRNLREELKRIKKDQKNGVKSLHDKIDESWDDIQTYIKIHQFAEKLPGGPSKVANDNELLDKLVMEAGNRNQVGSRSASAAKSEFKSKLSNIDRWETAHKDTLQKFENELEAELEIEDTEAKRLKEISSDDDKIRGGAQNVIDAIDRMESKGQINNKTSPDPSKVKTKLGIIKHLGKQIDDEVQDIYSIAQSEGEFENETLKKLRELYS